MRLLDATDLEVASTTTDSSGVYQFAGVASGAHRIEVSLPVDGVYSSQGFGGDTLEGDLIGDVDPSSGRSELFAYMAGSASRSWDAGLRILPIFAEGFESGDTSAWSESVS